MPTLVHNAAASNTRFNILYGEVKKQAIVCCLLHSPGAAPFQTWKTVAHTVVGEGYFAFALELNAVFMQRRHVERLVETQ